MHSDITPIFPQRMWNEALNSVFDMGLEVRRVDKKVMTDATHHGI